MLIVKARHRLGDFALDVDFTGPADGITVLFGPSGAGKSATLAVIAGLLRPAEGLVALGDDLLTDTASRRFVPPERRRIAMVHQDARLFPHMPVERNLRYGLRRARGAVRIGFDAVVDVLAIRPLLARRPHDLSGGERQRVALGRAMLSQPQLLLLDEPVSALDAALKDEVLAFVADLRRAFALPMVYVTHSRAEALRLADHVVLMDGGRVNAFGSAGAMLQQAGLVGVIISHGPTHSQVRFGDHAVDLPLMVAPVGSIVRITLGED